MPLTKKGKKVLKSMKKQYGAKKGKEVFYASIQSGKPGSGQWHKKGEASSSTEMTVDPVARKALKEL